MATYPLATVACTISTTGISAPALSDILASFQASVTGIYGSDIYIDPDSQDGQILAIYAQAQNDSNMATIAAYNSYNPQSALGVALDASVAQNGIVRQALSYSTIPVACVGVTGTQLFGCIVRDAAGNLWDLPDDVIIPDSGTITVTATCETAGNIATPAGAATIYTVTLGWQTATFTAPATPGAPVETDGLLRQRQAVSTSLSATSPLGTLSGAVGSVAGVSRSFVYQNDTKQTDANGIPANSVCAVVLGGVSTDIASAILLKKGVGAGTFGSTSVALVDPTGLPVAINYQPLDVVELWAIATITPLTGFTAAIAAQIQAALSTFVGSMSIGESVQQKWVEAISGLSGTAQQTFFLVSLTIGTAPNPTLSNGAAMTFDQAASLPVPNITVVVT